MSEAVVFQPEPSKFRRDLVFGVVFYTVACPAVLWWKAPALPIVWAAVGFVTGLALMVGLPLYRVSSRGFATVGVGPEGIVVSQRRGAFRLDWTSVARVHRIGGQLIFETVAPVKRYSLLLQGHEHHEEALFAAMKAHARTLDFAGLSSLGQIGNLLR